MKQKVIYPGTFDPVTNGHLDIIHRACNIFSEVVVAVAVNPGKQPYLSLDIRIALLEEALQGAPNVRVIGFDGLLVHFMQAHNANILLRGLRAVSDFEYEFQLAGMNRELLPAVETLFLTPSAQHMFISSSLVKEIAKLGGDIHQFVPPCVVDAMLKNNQGESMPVKRVL